jgi:fido (protein-threonine AMPylation protein)
MPPCSTTSTICNVRLLCVIVSRSRSQPFWTPPAFLLTSSGVSLPGIAKQGSAFCYPEHIDREMRRRFADLVRERLLRDLDAPTFAREAAHFLSELNAIHPFREGNGRTQLAFLTILAERAGYPLALERLAPSAFLQAIVRSFAGDERKLAELIGKLIQPEPVAPLAQGSRPPDGASGPACGRSARE